MIVCHIKQKDLEKQKFKRNKPCKQFRKQNSKGHEEDNKQYAIFKYEYVPFKNPRSPEDAESHLEFEPPTKRLRISEDKESDSDSPDEIDASMSSEYPSIAEDA